MGKEKENAHKQPPPISLNQLIEKIKNKKVYPRKELSRKSLNSILSKAEEKAEEKLIKHLIELYDKPELKSILQKQGISRKPHEPLKYPVRRFLEAKRLKPRGLQQLIKGKSSKHREYSEKLKNKGTLSKRQERILNELDSNFEKLNEFLKSQEAKLSSNTFKRKLKTYQKRVMESVLKAYRAGLVDHPLVKNWITTLYEFRHKRDLERKRIDLKELPPRTFQIDLKRQKKGKECFKKSFVLEAGLTKTPGRALTRQEAELYTEILDLEEIAGSLVGDEYNYEKELCPEFYRILKQQGNYKKSYPAFKKLLTRLGFID